LSRNDGFDVRAAIGTGLLARGSLMSSSRKKTDKWDAHWIGKLLASQMMPPPVLLPPASSGLDAASLRVRTADHLLAVWPSLRVPLP